MSSLLTLKSEAITYAIEKSCKCKADIVASDEHEKSGRRALLNLGHTFGHAIETGMGYGTWLHGEAVGCGMLIAAHFSQKLGWIDKSEVNEIKHVISSANLPIHLPKELSADKMLELMSVDKKVKNGNLYLVLLKDVGDAVLTCDYDLDLLKDMLIEINNSM